MIQELHLALLGGLRITEGGEPLPGLTSHKGQALLCYLALSRRPHTRDALASLLWSDNPQEEARANLRAVLFLLRKVASPHLLVTRDTVAFNLQSRYRLDVDLFRDKIASGNARQANGDAGALTALREAMEIYQGEFLDGYYVPGASLFEEWVLTERQWLHGIAIEALQLLAGECIHLSDTQAAINYLNRLLVLEPWREEARRDLMRLLAETGQRSAALAEYETCRRILLAELGVEPGEETTTLYRQILSGEVSPRTAAIPQSPPKPAPRPATNLPAALTPLFGRDAELPQLADRLQRPAVRLLTLIGEGGIGKTHLAIELASRLLPAFPDGVFLVALSALRDVELVPSAIARALKLQERESQPSLDILKEWLAERKVLLVLDNFEQLLDATGTVVELLQIAPALKIVVTSREPLATFGEHVFPVQPLPVPDPMQHIPALESLEQFSSIALFCARAEAVRFGFALTASNAPSVTDVCRRLDGSPLAIELAASQAGELQIDEIARRLNDRFRFLAKGNRAAPERHQTLQACIEWSYELLSEQDRLLFRRLSVFAGGWTLEGAVAVCSNDEGQETKDGGNVSSSVSLESDIADGIRRLVVKSLVVLDPETSRYRMHESIRQYAADKLDESGEAEALHSSHLRCFTERAEAAEQPLRGANQTEWLARLDAEHDNFRAALHRAKTIGESGRPEDRDEASELGLRLAGVFWWFWYLRGYYSEGREQLAKMLSLKPAGEGLKAMRAKALTSAGILAWKQGDYASARALYEESLAITRDLGDKSGIASSLNNLGIVAYRQADYTAARALYEESLALLREREDQMGIASVLINLGDVAIEQGDYTAAQSMFEEGLAINRKLGDSWRIAVSLNGVGRVAYVQRDYTAAQSMFEESLAIRRALGDQGGTALMLNNLGALAHAEGDYELEHSLLAESLGIYREIGDNLGITVCLAGLGGAAVTGVIGTVGVSQVEQVERGARLLGAVEGLLQSMGVVLDRFDRESYEDNVKQARAKLGEAVFQKVWQEGRVMTMEEAIAYTVEVATTWAP